MKMTFPPQSPNTSQPASPTDEISVRRFSTFSLLTPEAIEDPDPSSSWYRYSTTVLDRKYSIEISHLTKSFTAQDLMGFNNTGNVCVWPSEESLSIYALGNIAVFEGASVLELGAGMSALAGLMVAKYGGPKKVHLTDGNRMAVSNIEKSVERNAFACDVRSGILQWGREEVYETFDVILSADCLFFDEARNDLVDTIFDFLAERGVALVMAPRRGSTLDVFVAAAVAKGFDCEKRVYYDREVWKRHLECLQSVAEYDEDIHYPLLLILKKNRQ